MWSRMGEQHRCYTINTVDIITNITNVNIITNINNVDIITNITNVVSIVVCRSLSLGTSPVLTIEEAQRQDGGVR